MENIEILAIAVVLVMLIAVFFIIIFACTKSRREYGRIKNREEAEGTITNIEYHDFDLHTESREYYIVHYSFTDICGKTHNKQFQEYRTDKLNVGDKITVYYDVDDPNKCVTAYKLKTDKNLWWKASLIAAVIIGVPFIVVFLANRK
ncbi:MAG: DUF3592 domain-containing protein [Alistipes sp.]|nr:DUF3592 domain-containing protein [Alistipes sp.]